MINKVILIGNVGADPTIRCFKNGGQVAKFRLVTTERFKGKDGEKKELNEWHNVEAWGTPAAILDQYVRKGDRLYIEGQLHYEEYTDKGGQTRYQTIIRLREIKLLTPRQKQEEQAQPQEQPSPQVAELAKQLELTAVPEPPQVPLPPMQDPEDLPF